MTGLSGLDKLIELAEKGGPFVAVFMTVMFIWAMRRLDRLEKKAEEREDASLTALRESSEVIRDFNTIFKPSRGRPRT